MERPSALTALPPSRFAPSRPRSALAFLFAVLPALAACGGSTPPPREADTAHEAEPPPSKPALHMKSELGSVDPEAVKRAFQALDDKFMECAKRDLDRVEVLAGSVKFFVRIGEDGTPKWAYLEDSDVGDRDVEKCLVATVLGARFPKPDGGDAEARYAMELPQQSTRPPSDWSSEKVTRALAKHAEALDRCKGGATGLQATMYVGPGGKVLAAGVVGAGKDGDEKADCLADVLEKMKGLPSPGSWPAKVRFSL